MLTLILGPMKSGKSMDLISYFAPFKYSLQSYALFQNEKHVREADIRTRNGIILEAKRVSSIAEALGKNYTAVGIDEAHMFPESEVNVIEQLLKQGTKVVVSGLDTNPWG
ncbi:MAG TPA: thymidine kinase, partial [Patescibacteria group bacterium]|nr:thymidine kinase [Patescibacteria group bacterium]